MAGVTADEWLRVQASFMAVHLVDVAPLATTDPSATGVLPVSRESRISVTEFTSNAKSLPPHPVQAIQENVLQPFWLITMTMSLKLSW